MAVMLSLFWSSKGMFHCCYIESTQLTATSTLTSPTVSPVAGRVIVIAVPIVLILLLVVIATAVGVVLLVYCRSRGLFY